MTTWRPSPEPAPPGWRWRWDEDARTLCLDSGDVHPTLGEPASICFDYLTPR